MWEIPVKIRFKRTIRQSGGSLAITIPSEILEALSLHKGDEVSIYVEDHRIIIEKSV